MPSYVSSKPGSVGNIYAFSLNLPYAYQEAQGIPPGWWGACKVIGRRESMLVVACLDWFGEAQPTEEDVSESAVLVAPVWPHHHPDLPMVDWRVPHAQPDGFIKIVQRPVTEREDACIEPIRSAGGWGGVWAKACAVWRWRHDRAALEDVFRSWKRRPRAKPRRASP